LGQEGRGNREVKKIHNEGFNDLYSSPNIILVIKQRKKNGIGGECSTYGEMRGAYRVLVEEP